MDRNLKASIICFVIAGILLYLLEGCATKQIELKTWCRHEALFVASVLSEKYPGRSGIEWMRDPNDKDSFHVQAYAKIVGDQKTYFRIWDNYVVNCPKDNQGWLYYKDQTLHQFFNSQYRWWR
jgi:hypothetical protein